MSVDLAAPSRDSRAHRSGSRCSLCPRGWGWAQGQVWPHWLCADAALTPGGPNALFCHFVFPASQRGGVLSSILSAGGEWFSPSRWDYGSHALGLSLLTAGAPSPPPLGHRVPLCPLGPAAVEGSEHPPSGSPAPAWTHPHPCPSPGRPQWQVVAPGACGARGAHRSGGAVAPVRWDSSVKCAALPPRPDLAAGGHCEAEE